MKWIIIAGLSMLLTTCSPQNNTSPFFSSQASTPANKSTPDLFTDGGLISQTPCGPPCFYGIVPGETTEQEAIAIIDQNRSFHPCDIRRNPEDSDPDRYTLDCLYVEVGFNDGIVVGIVFFPRTRITVRELIKLFGNPDAVMVRVFGLPDQDTNAYMDLFYDDIFLTISLADQYNQNQYSVDEGTPVGIVGYDTKDGYEELRAPPFYTNWIGYGEYTDTIP